MTPLKPVAPGTRIALGLAFFALFFALWGLATFGGFVAKTFLADPLEGAPVTGPGADRGMVFRSYTLFPWLTVVQNICFDLREKNVPPGEQRDIAAHYIDRVGLNGFMANRVVVMSARPGRIKTQVRVDLPHPRHYTMKTALEFSALKARLTEEIRAEAMAALG